MFLEIWEETNLLTQEHIFYIMLLVAIGFTFFILSMNKRIWILGLFSVLIFVAVAFELSSFPIVFIGLIGFIIYLVIYTFILSREGN